MKPIGASFEFSVNPKYLFSRGLRYRVNNRRLPGSPDIVLKKYKTVIFIDGCFWHGHEGCKYYRLPKTNVDFWKHKIAMNIARDFANGVELRLAGWKVVRVWECDLKTKAKREETLEQLYNAIVRTGYKSSAYESTPSNASIAAEPSTPYGDNKN